MGNIEFIFEPDPSGGGHGECITKDQVFIRLGTIDDLEMAPELNAHLTTLKENELIALELDELNETDVEPIRAFAETHGRAVFVRRSSLISTFDTSVELQSEEHGVARR